MKTALTTAALLFAMAAPASAQNLIARLPSQTVHLTNEACPGSSYSKMAIHTPYPGQASYGCWYTDQDKVRISWFRLGTPNPPRELRLAQFSRIED